MHCYRFCVVEYTPALVQMFSDRQRSALEPCKALVYPFKFPSWCKTLGPSEGSLTWTYWHQKYSTTTNSDFCFEISLKEALPVLMLWVPSKR